MVLFFDVFTNSKSVNSHSKSYDPCQELQGPNFATGTRKSSKKIVHARVVENVLGPFDRRLDANWDQIFCWKNANWHSSFCLSNSINQSIHLFHFNCRSWFTTEVKQGRSLWRQNITRISMALTSNTTLYSSSSSPYNSSQFVYTFQRPKSHDSKYAYIEICV